MYHTLWLIILFLTNTVISEECTNEILACNDLMTEINSSIVNTRYVGKNGSDEGDCSVRENPCKTLKYASFLNQSRSSISFLKIKINPGEYSLFNYFYDSNNIVLEGSEDRKTTIRCGNATPSNDTCFFENFAFYNCFNIWIKNIVFDSCGPYSSAHFMFNSSNIILENNVYQHGTTTAVIVYLTSPIYVVNSVFINNVVHTISNEKCLSRSNGVFYRDNATSTGGISVFSKNRTQGILISNSQFDSNFARNNTEDSSIPSQLKQFGHGGGLSLRLVNSSSGFVCIINSSFIKNTAEVGGGAISFIIADNSSYNTITFLNVTFNKNVCFIDKCIGGGLQVDLFAPAKHNRIILSKCNFSNNIATLGSGGAVSIASSDKGFSEDGSDAYDLVTIDYCIFKGNVAKFEGTAVGLFSLGRVNQAGFRISMKDW